MYKGQLIKQKGMSYNTLRIHTFVCATIFVLLEAVSGCAPATLNSGPHLIASFPADSDDLSMPFITPKAALVYYNPIAGLLIEQVIADKSEIRAREIIVEDFELARKKDAKDMGYVYLVMEHRSKGFGGGKSWCLTSASTFAKGDYMFVVHEIPSDARHIKITYRVRFPDGSHGPRSILEMTAEE